MSWHPVDDLTADHRVIELALDAIAREADRTDTANPPRTEFWRRASEFVANFADLCHHGKEEDLLFPELEAAGLPAEHGPTAVMRCEHVEGRELTRRFKVAAEAGESDDLVSAARAYVHLLRDHIGKEDSVLFPMARAHLDADAIERLHTGFARVEQAFGGDARARYEQVARELGEAAAATP